MLVMKICILLFNVLIIETFFPGFLMLLQILDSHFCFNSLISHFDQFVLCIILFLIVICFFQVLSYLNFLFLYLFFCLKDFVHIAVSEFFLTNFFNKMFPIFIINVVLIILFNLSLINIDCFLLKFLYLYHFFDLILLKTLSILPHF